MADQAHDSRPPSAPPPSSPGSEDNSLSFPQVQDNSSSSDPVAATTAATLERRAPLPIDAVPPGSSPSVADSATDSITTQTTTTVGGPNQTQVNVINRETTVSSRPSTADNKQFYPNIIPLKKHQQLQQLQQQQQQQETEDDDSEASRSTAQRTNMSSTIGHRRPPSRSHVPAIMPSYSFYHPLRPPAVVNAAAQQQIPQPEISATSEAQNRLAQSSSAGEEIPSVHGKPSTEPLLPATAPAKDVHRLYPLVETASTRTNRGSTQLLANAAPATSAPVSHTVPHPRVQEPVMPSQQKTRNWEHFPGKTKYHLGGRVQFGRQYWANVGTLTLILIPTGLYFGFTYLLRVVMC